MMVLLGLLGVGLNPTSAFIPAMPSSSSASLSAVIPLHEPGNIKGNSHLQQWVTSSPHSRHHGQTALCAATATASVVQEEITSSPESTTAQGRDVQVVVVVPGSGALSPLKATWVEVMQVSKETTHIVRLLQQHWVHHRHNCTIFHQPVCQ